VNSWPDVEFGSFHDKTISILSGKRAGEVIVAITCSDCDQKWTPSLTFQGGATLKDVFSAAIQTFKQMVPDNPPQPASFF
jgi:hypothetical protein